MRSRQLKFHHTSIPLSLLTKGLILLFNLLKTDLTTFSVLARFDYNTPASLRLTDQPKVRVISLTT